MENKKPPDFDWVTARAKCSTAVLFEQLQADVEQDAARARELMDEGYSLEVKRYSDRMILVILADNLGVAESIRFKLENNAIMVTRRDDVEIMRGVPTISDDKQCRLLVDGKERELWQFRKLALEGLFFRW